MPTYKEMKNELINIISNLAEAGHIFEGCQEMCNIANAESGYKAQHNKFYNLMRDSLKDVPEAEMSEDLKTFVF